MEVQQQHCKVRWVHYAAALWCARQQVGAPSTLRGFQTTIIISWSGLWARAHITLQSTATFVRYICAISVIYKFARSPTPLRLSKDSRTFCPV